MVVTLSDSEKHLLLPIAQRIGRRPAKSTKPRPMRLSFISEWAKHDFLAYAKDFRKQGVRIDDDLTRQQQQRSALNPDFQLLKTKGYKPFFRGAALRYRAGNKIATCNRGQATKLPTASKA